MMLAVDVEHLASHVGLTGSPSVRHNVAGPKVMFGMLTAGKRGLNFT